MDILPEHQIYLGFAWEFVNGGTKFCILNVLPFRLSTALCIFSKLLRPLIKLWRGRGFHPLVYLDYGLNLEESFEKANYASHHTRGDRYMQLDF